MTITTMKQARKAFSELLDEIYPEGLEIYGTKFKNAKSLRRNDPIMFNEELLNWLDSEGIDTDDLA